MMKKMTTVMVHEILDTLASISIEYDKVVFLRKLHPSYQRTLKTLARYAYDKKLKLQVPGTHTDDAIVYDGRPIAINPTPFEDPSAMNFAVASLPKFVPPLSDTMSDSKRIGYWIEILEELVEGDRRVLLSVKDDRKVPHLTKRLAEKTWGLLDA